MDLLELARTVAPEYVAAGNVAAIVAAGSVGRGRADGYSDVELDVYWNLPPSDEQRGGPIMALGGSRMRLWPYDSDEGEWSEDYRLGGIDICVSGFLSDTVSRWIEDVVGAGDPGVLKQMRLAAINDGTVLYGDSVVAKWRERSRNYPDTLAIAVATEYLDVERLGSWHQRRALVARGDVILLRAMMPDIVAMILGALCAANRVFIEHPKFKWSEQLIGRLAIAPTDLRQRLRAVADGPVIDATRIVHDLLAETIALVERELPFVPLDELREALAGGRALP